MISFVEGRSGRMQKDLITVREEGVAGLGDRCTIGQTILLELNPMHLYYLLKKEISKRKEGETLRGG
jgi:hypothetical protein